MGQWNTGRGILFTGPDGDEMMHKAIIDYTEKHKFKRLPRKRKKALYGTRNRRRYYNRFNINDLSNIIKDIFQL